MILGLTMLALAATIALAGYLWFVTETLRWQVAELEEDLARMREPLPPRERLERRRVARVAR